MAERRNILQAKKGRFAQRSRLKMWSIEHVYYILNYVYIYTYLYLQKETLDVHM